MIKKSFLGASCALLLDLVLHQCPLSSHTHSSCFICASGSEPFAHTKFSQGIIITMCALQKNHRSTKSTPLALLLPALLLLPLTSAAPSLRGQPRKAQAQVRCLPGMLAHMSGAMWWARQ